MSVTAPVAELVEVAVGVADAEELGPVVGDGDCEGDCEGLDDWVGDAVADDDGDDIVADGDPDGDCAGLPVAVDVVGHSVGEAVANGGRTVGIGVGPRFPGPAAVVEAVLETEPPPAGTYWVGSALAVAVGWQLGEPAPPYEVRFSVPLPPLPA